MSGIKAAVRLYRDAIAPELEQAAKDACKGVGGRPRVCQPHPAGTCQVRARSGLLGARARGGKDFDI